MQPTKNNNINGNQPNRRQVRNRFSFMEYMRTNKISDVKSPDREKVWELNNEEQNSSMLIDMCDPNSEP